MGVFQQMLSFQVTLKMLGYLYSYLYISGNVILILWFAYFFLSLFYPHIILFQRVTLEEGRWGMLLLSSPGACVYVKTHFCHGESSYELPSYE